MNRFKRCAFVGLTCLLSSRAQAGIPLSYLMLRGTKAIGYGLAYAITSPFIFLDYVSGRTEEYEEEQTPSSKEPNASMSIENIAPSLGRGPAIIVTVNNNNQQSSTEVPGRPATDSMYDIVTKKAHRSFRWLRNNKLSALILCATGAYAGLQTYLWYLAHYLSNDTRWSNWKRHCTLEDLYALPHKELIKDLAEETRQRYNSDSPFENLKLFVEQASKEIILLNRYKKLSHFARLALIKKLFFISDEVLESIEERVQRLIFVRSVAITWLNDQQKQLQTLLG